MSLAPPRRTGLRLPALFAADRKCLGNFALALGAQGLREPKVIWQALPARLAAAREFQLPPEHMAQRVSSLTAKRAAKGSSGPSFSGGSSESGGGNGMQLLPKCALTQAILLRAVAHVIRERMLPRGSLGDRKACA